MEVSEQPPQIPQATKQPSMKHKTILQVSVVSLLIIIGALSVLRPWHSDTNNDRTVSVTGQATVEAEPDQYLFSPSYEFKDANKDKALDALTKKSDEIIAGLRATGVAEEDIKTNSSGYDYPKYYTDEGTDEVTYQLYMTVTVTDKELAQKVQNYLLSTSPMGSISPNPTFSDQKQKDLEATAQTEATKDARTKAEQMARDLGFKLGKVKTITTNQTGGIYPIAMDVATSAAEPSIGRTETMAIQPGKNEVTYIFNIEYYIK